MFDNKFIFILILIQITLCSCNKKILSPDIEQKSVNDSIESQVYLCRLVALDLTEDVSIMSTRNDELVVLVYRDSLNQKYPDLIYQDYFVIDSLRTIKKFSLYDTILKNSNFTFILIEVDTRKTLAQIESIVKLNFDDILKAQFSGNSKVLNHLFGDDDLIGIEKIPTSDLKCKNVAIEFKGIHLFDSYKYQLKIKNNCKIKKIEH